MDFYCTGCAPEPELVEMQHVDHIVLYARMHECCMLLLVGVVRNRTIIT